MLRFFVADIKPLDQDIIRHQIGRYYIDEVILSHLFNVKLG